MNLNSASYASGMAPIKTSAFLVFAHIYICQIIGLTLISSKKAGTSFHTCKL